jgi:hypothetical protein
LDLRQRRVVVFVLGQHGTRLSVVPTFSQDLHTHARVQLQDATVAAAV